MNDPVDHRRNQPEPWSKTSGTNRMTYIPKLATIDALGPGTILFQPLRSYINIVGTYNVEEKELAIKHRPSANFVSKMDRASSVKLRRSHSSGRSTFRAMPLKGLLGNEEMFDDENYEEEEEEEDEYVKVKQKGNMF